MDVTEMSDAELDARALDLQAQRDAIRADLKAVTVERDTRATKRELAQKLAQFTPAELAELAKRAQIVSPTGIPSRAVVGTPGQ
jgi:hypothetical protein